MSRTDAPTAIDPQAYASWRATSLGAVTEALEQDLILDIMGEIRGAHVLDAGCGDGTLVCAMSSLGAEVTGVDPDSAMLATARAHAHKAGIEARFLEGRVERLPFPDAAFDVVTAVRVLCFVPDAGGAVRELARVLRPGGRLVLGELGRWSLWAAIRRLRGWLGSGRWRGSVLQPTCVRSSKRAGISVTAVRGAVFYPPVGIFARVLAPLDPWLGRLTTFGAAFIVLRAVVMIERRRV